MARHAVTGASGFLGRHVVSTLQARGHEVVTRRADVADKNALLDMFAGCEGVFHCAGKVSRKPEDAEMLHRLLVIGTKNVADACKLSGSVKRLVVASTSGTVAVSEDPEHVAVETDETPIGLIARWPYYRAKLFAERAALEANGPNLEVVCVNPTLLLGPGDVNGSSTEDVRLFLERKIPFTPPGGLSFVDARDAAEGMVLAYEKGVPGKRYLLGACNLTVREFFARLERTSGVRAPAVPMPRLPSVSRAGAELVEKALGKFGASLPVDPVSVEMSQYYWYLDSSLAEKELGWSGRDPIATLHDTVEDLRNRGVVWPKP